MTKDGRPSRLRDIRIFAGNRSTYLDRPTAVAHARRLAWWLNGEGYSVGSNHTVFVYLSTEHPEGYLDLGVSIHRGEGWQMREVTVGVGSEQLAFDADRVAIDAVERALSALNPQESGRVLQASKLVAGVGDGTRFLLRSKESVREVLEVCTTIATSPAPSRVTLSVTDMATGVYRESPAIHVPVYDDGVYLAGKIRKDRDRVSLDPRGTYPAQLIRSGFVEFGWRLDQLVETDRPTISGLLKLR